MYTDYIPLPTDETERNKILGLVESLDEFLPGQMVVADAIQITTDNPRMAELLQAIFHQPEPTPQQQQPAEKTKKASKKPAQAQEPAQQPAATLAEIPCDECGKKFQPKRKDARFCSGKCSQTWHYKHPSPKSVELAEIQREKRQAARQAVNQAYKNAMARSVMAK